MDNMASVRVMFWDCSVASCFYILTGNDVGHQTSLDIYSRVFPLSKQQFLLQNKHFKILHPPNTYI